MYDMYEWLRREWQLNVGCWRLIQLTNLQKWQLIWVNIFLINALFPFPSCWPITMSDVGSITAWLEAGATLEQHQMKSFTSPGNCSGGYLMLCHTRWAFKASAYSLTLYDKVRECFKGKGSLKTCFIFSPQLLQFNIQWAFLWIGQIKALC